MDPRRPTLVSQAGAVLRAAAGDHGGDALLPDLLAVPVMVIAPVGADLTGPLARPSAAAPRRRDKADIARQAVRSENYNA